MARAGSTHDKEKMRKERKKNDLPLGAVKAITQLRHRVPTGVDPALGQVADRAFERLVNVMEGKVSFRQAPSVLKAATAVREEICGPIVKDFKFQGTLTLEQLLARVEDGT